MCPLSWSSDNGPDAVHVALHGRPDGDSATVLRRMLGRYDDRRLTLDLTGMSPRDQAWIAGATLPTCWGALTRGSVMLLDRPLPVDAAKANKAAGLAIRMARDLDVVRQAVTVPRLESATFTEQLLPVSGAARRGRDVATGACLAWDRLDLTPATTLLASELISYVGRAASTFMTLTVRLSGDVVYVCMSSGSDWERLPAGDDAALGLLLIHSMADQWGSLSDDGDRLTWATITAPGSRTRPDGSALL